MKQVVVGGYAIFGSRHILSVVMLYLHVHLLEHISYNIAILKVNLKMYVCSHILIQFDV